MITKLKTFKTTNEQICLLKSRGLIIDNEDEAYSTLERINYYRFTGYLHTYKKDNNNKYLKGVSFEKISKIYEFDVKLTRLLLYVLKEIEELLNEYYELSTSNSTTTRS